MVAHAGAVCPEDRQREGDGEGGGPGSGGHDETAASRCTPRASLRLDARPQGGRRLDLGRGALRKRDGAPLLGQSLGQLGRGLDSRLERGTPLRRQRSVGERRQLGFIKRELCLRIHDNQ